MYSEALISRFRVSTLNLCALFLVKLCCVFQRILRSCDITIQFLDTFRMSVGSRREGEVPIVAHLTRLYQFPFLNLLLLVDCFVIATEFVACKPICCKASVKYIRLCLLLFCFNLFELSS